MIEVPCSFLLYIRQPHSLQQFPQHLLLPTEILRTVRVLLLSHFRAFVGSISFCRCFSVCAC
jgi:hypothetical protein